MMEDLLSMQQERFRYVMQQDQLLYAAGPALLSSRTISSIYSRTDSSMWQDRLLYAAGLAPLCRRTSSSMQQYQLLHAVDQLFYKAGPPLLCYMTNPTMQQDSFCMQQDLILCAVSAVSYATG